MKQDPPSCSIARLEYFFWLKTLSLVKTRKQTISNVTRRNREWWIHGLATCRHV